MSKNTPSFKLEDLILSVIRMPTVHVDRTSFLKGEFVKYCNEDQLNQIVKMNPAKAGINNKIVDTVANNVIAFERNTASLISTGLGIPGGFAAVGTVPVDIAQNYGALLRVAQKLMYVYGFPDLEIGNRDNPVDSGTYNILLLMLGTMTGVVGASTAIQKLARMLATNIPKRLMRQALTKGTIYPIVKNVAKYLGVHMSKKVFSNGVGKAIPIVGGVISGAFTMGSMQICCNRLKSSLKDSPLSNLNYVFPKNEEIE